MSRNQSSVGNILFRIFWWVIQHINPMGAHKLMYWGLRDGAFPRQILKDPALTVNLWGHAFSNPIGIAEGVDRRGNVIDNLIAMGYSFGEFGPFTLEKEMPLRKNICLKKEKAILTQCFGYRNPGIGKILPVLVKRRYLPHYIGVDLAIPAEAEEQNIKQGRHFTYQDEFVLMSQKVAPYCDFITLNISHPNSELSMLAVDPSTIVPIVKAVKEAVQTAAPIQTPPILIKIPLDINAKEVPLVAKALIDSQVDGVIVAGPLSVSKNTTLQLSIKDDDQMGMLIGMPTREIAVNLIRTLYRACEGKVTIIGCGGIFSAEDAFAQICAGASLVQLDTASLTFAGPTVIYSIYKGLLNLLTQKGFTTIEKAIGSDHQNQGEHSTDALDIPTNPTTSESAPETNTVTSEQNTNPDVAMNLSQMNTTAEEPQTPPSDTPQQ